MSRWPSAAFAVALLVTLPVTLPARADVPPAPNSPDAHSTLAAQCAHGVFCPYAFRPGKPPSPNGPPVGLACRTSATGKGLERRCRHGGNYSGDELYCPKGETGSWAPPTAAPAATPPPATGAAPSNTPPPATDAGSPATGAKPSSGCAVTPDGSSKGGLGGVAVIAAIGMAKRFRRRARAKARGLAS